MAAIRQNRLIPLFALIVLVMVGGVIFKSRDPDKRADIPVPLKAVPTPDLPRADADSPADTLRTLTAEVSRTKEEIQKLREENTELRKQNDAISHDKSVIEDNVTRNLVNQLSRPEASGSPVFSNLNARIDELAVKVEHYSSSGAPVAPGSDIPEGLGYDTASSGTPSVKPHVTDSTQWIWIEPMGTRTVTGPDGQPQIVRAAFSPATAPGAASGSESVPATFSPAPTPLASEPAMEPSATREHAMPATPSTKPYFTIPENATLIGSTAMTALVGRIPVNGKITDAMPFKVLIGRPNLAANGLEVPAEIAGMVVSGIAVGDWTLSCTQGFVQSVTFLFQDGSIRTVSQRNQGALTENVGAPLVTTQKIGWLSDERGVPCIAGKRITNAPSYLSTVVGLKSIETAARAAALSQTTTSTNALGGTTTSLTGDESKYILGHMAAGGVNEITEWIKQRLNNSFDAVYVQPGLPVAVHIEQEIVLDKAPEARRLDYEQSNRARRARTAHLD